MTVKLLVSTDGGKEFKVLNTIRSTTHLITIKWWERTKNRHLIEVQKHAAVELMSGWRNCGPWENPILRLECNA
jgi:hypothetical protein